MILQSSNLSFVCELHMQRLQSGMFEESNIYRQHFL